MTNDEKLLDMIKKGSDHHVDAMRYYVEAGTYGIGGVHCIDEEIPNTAAEKKVVHLARQSTKRFFDVPESVISEYESFTNKRLTKKRFRKQLQACGFQRNDINKVMEDIRKYNRPYTLGVAYSYTALGRYMPQLYCYARAASMTPEESCSMGLYTIKKTEKDLKFYRR